MSIDAFVLTFRFFIQDNESSSFRSIAAVYDSGAIDEELKKRFESARNAVNDFLDSPSFLADDHGRISYRDVMEVFVYGGLAHANPKKYRRFNDWMSFPPGAVLFEGCFTWILSTVMSAITYIAGVNRDAIEKLTTMMQAIGDLSAHGHPANKEQATPRDS